MSKESFQAAYRKAWASLPTVTAARAVNDLLYEVTRAGGTVEDSRSGELAVITIRIGDVVVASASDPDCLRATVDAAGQMAEKIKWP